MSNIRTKSYPLATLEYNPETNILIYRIKQGIEVDVYEITEMQKYAEEFKCYVKHYAVVDFGSNVMSTTEARNKYAAPNYIQTYRIADAFLVKSLGAKIVANFFIKVTRPQTPTKLFTDEQTAINWLINYK